jgi:hypothetical protein
VIDGIRVDGGLVKKSAVFVTLVAFHSGQNSCYFGKNP